MRAGCPFFFLEKIVMNTPWPFEVLLKKEDILKDMKKWLALLNSEVLLQS